MGKVTGYEKPEQQGRPRSDPFDELNILTCRDLARNQGAEALGKEGPSALMRLPTRILASLEIPAIGIGQGKKAYAIRPY